MGVFFAELTPGGLRLRNFLLGPPGGAKPQIPSCSGLRFRGLRGSPMFRGLGGAASPLQRMQETTADCWELS